MDGNKGGAGGIGGRTRFFLDIVTVLSYDFLEGNTNVSFISTAQFTALKNAKEITKNRHILEPRSTLTEIN